MCITNAKIAELLADEIGVYPLPPMTQHFNIAQKKEINPFEKVMFVAVNNCQCSANQKLLSILNKSDKVSTRKLNNNWVILYDIKMLDFVTLIKWKEPFRGTFQIIVSVNHGYTNRQTIEFKIEDDVMHCW